MLKINTKVLILSILIGTRDNISNIIRIQLTLSSFTVISPFIMVLIYSILLTIGIFLLFYIPKALIGGYKARPIQRMSIKPMIQPIKVKVRVSRANTNMVNLNIAKRGRA